MMPDAMKNESQVYISDSCNNCCCFQWKRRNKKTATVDKKIESQMVQADLSKPVESPRKPEHTFSHLKIEITQEDDIQFVQEFSVGPEKQ